MLISSSIKNINQFTCILYLWNECRYLESTKAEKNIQKIAIEIPLDFVVYCIHSNLSHPGSAGPEGARYSEFARISEYLATHMPIIRNIP